MEKKVIMNNRCGQFTDPRFNLLIYAYIQDGCVVFYACMSHVTKDPLWQWLKLVLVTVKTQKVKVESY